jgi:hypothetical protein
MGNKDKFNKEASCPGDDRIKEIVQKESKDGELPCAIAFVIGHQNDISPEIIGKCADALKVKLVKCQLGLFGYHPGKKIVKPATDVAAELKSDIKAALINGRLPCASAWKIAEKFHTGKMDISSACEKMGIKIKPCQLGAF